MTKMKMKMTKKRVRIRRERDLSFLDDLYGLGVGTLPPRSVARPGTWRHHVFITLTLKAEIESCR